MKSYDWAKTFPAAITVADAQGIIIEMNEAAAAMHKNSGGFGLIGKNIMGCYNPGSRAKIRKIMETGSSNIYSITKNGKKQLVYQAPFHKDGKISGVVEILIDLPHELSHYDRDAQRPS